MLLGIATHSKTSMIHIARQAVRQPHIQATQNNTLAPGRPSPCCNRYEPDIFSVPFTELRDLPAFQRPIESRKINISNSPPKNTPKNTKLSSGPVSVPFSDSQSRRRPVLSTPRRLAFAARAAYASGSFLGGRTLLLSTAAAALTAALRLPRPLLVRLGC